MPILTFVGRDQWRGRGRPKAVASQEVIDALRQTSAEGPIARVPLESPVGSRGRASELAQYRRELGAAAKVLGVRLKTQVKGDHLLFYQVPLSRTENDDGQ